MLFTTSLFAAAVHLDACLGIGHSRRTLTFKGKSIQLIQRALKNDPKKHNSALIGAVLTVASYSNAQGDFQETQNHLLGLEKLVDSEGGLQGLGMAGVLRALCILHNQGFAAFNDVPLQPQLGSATEWNLPPAILNMLMPLVSPLATTSDLSTLQIDGRCSTRTLSMLGFFQTLSKLILDGGSTADVSRFMCSADSEAELRTMHRANKLDYVEESCRLAGLVFTTAIMQHKSFAASDMSQELVGLLHRAIQHTDFGSHWGEPLMGVLLWVYLVGGAASVAAPERAFFVTNFVGLGLAVAPLNWPALHSCVSNFIAVQAYLRGGVSN